MRIHSASFVLSSWVERRRPAEVLAGAKAFEWKQDIGINQARRTGQVAVLATSSAGQVCLAPAWLLKLWYPRVSHTYVCLQTPRLKKRHPQVRQQNRDQRY